MKIYLAIIIVVALLIIGFMIFLTVTKRRRTMATNFRALLIIGFSLIPVGIATKNYWIWLIGIVFMIISLVNRKQWKNELQWSELPASEKVVRVFLMAIAIILFIAGVTLFLIRK